MRKGVQKIFAEVSETYELVNHVLTFGLDSRWRKKAARIASKARKDLWIDICSGTGEMAEALFRLTGNQGRVIALDFSLQMLAKAASKSGGKKIFFTLAEASRLPFADQTFELVTISFATRNINISREALVGCFREFHRVLKPGARFVNLETSQPRSKLIRWLFHFYVRLAVRPIGLFLSGSKAGYIYLARTIPRFYEPEELAQILNQAGFNRVDFDRLFLGVIAIHTAIK
jgi:demethylmenaquinone methyltransferase/2-methoxy-6-polyprenyl-1,4-benzoquinol methylase